MDKLLNAIKCHHCHQILITPIILPCGHSMCKAHADKAGDQVKCPKCGGSHQNQGFLVNTDFLEVIDSQIGSMDFGPCHKEAKDACDQLEDVLGNIYGLLKDPIYFLHETIDELKHRVLLKREKLKLEIDERAEKLLTLLAEHQKKCELNFEKSSFEDSVKNLEKIKRETENMSKESLDSLNQFKFDDERWKNIKKECELKIEEINKEFETVKKLLLLDEFEQTEDQVNFFVNFEKDNFLRMEIYSKILNREQKTQLGEICQISPQKKWTLLWRGSRDGFGAEDFHYKCDNIPNTLTVIKTTRGRIFGGYTERTWNCANDTFAQDPNAYIFSLVNDVNRSFVMKVKDPEHAIFTDRSRGPTFGYEDIDIHDESNMSWDNYAQVKSYRPPDNLTGNAYILEGSRNFQVQDIEVFHLE